MKAEQTADVLIVGGGLAGASTAYALAKRNIRSLIVERSPALACGASGNRYGLLMPYISSSSSPTETLYSAGFDFSRTLLTRELREDALFIASGGLQLPSTARLRRLLTADSPLCSPEYIERVTANEAAELSNYPLAGGGFFVAKGGYVSPPALVSTLVARFPSQISVLCGAEISSILREENSWLAHLADGTHLSADRVVISSAYEAASLDICSWLPLEPIRGQTSIVKSSPASEKLRTLLCFDGYITPAHGSEHLIGAVYRHGDLSHEASNEDSHAIIDRCNRAVPHLEITHSSLVSARACFRTSTFDRLPYIGALPDFRGMYESARHYQSGTDLTQRVPPRFHPGLFVSLGHGSRGLLSCPLAGEIIARNINGEDQLVLREAARITAAERFVYRALRTLTSRDDG